MWSFRRNQGKETPPDKREQVATAPPNDVSPFTVPNYRRGGPYSQEAVPTYTDAMQRQAGEHGYETITEQHRRFPWSTYPPAGYPPSEWTGYEQDNWQRSQEDENVVNAEEGPQFGVKIPKQVRMHPALNPYWLPNIVKRPQRSPAEWSFLRPFDRYTLGKRALNGSHYSQAQTATDNNRLALQGMVPPLRRRSTYRLEPVQLGENTYSALANSTEGSPGPGPVISAVAGTVPRSFRLG